MHVYIMLTFINLELQLPGECQREVAHLLLEHVVKTFILGHCEEILPVTCFTCKDRKKIRDAYLFPTIKSQFFFVNVRSRGDKPLRMVSPVKRLISISSM